MQSTKENNILLHLRLPWFLFGLLDGAFVIACAVGKERQNLKNIAIQKQVYQKIDSQFLPYLPYDESWLLLDTVSLPEFQQWGSSPCLWCIQSFLVNLSTDFWKKQQMYSEINFDLRELILSMYAHSEVHHLCVEVWPFSCSERCFSSCSRWPSCCNTSTTSPLSKIKSNLRSLSLVL